MVYYGHILSNSGLYLMIHTFDEKYWDDAIRNLGEAFDFARNACQINLDDFSP